jgi:putative peptidoglycan lipid II flippase
MSVIDPAAEDNLLRKKHVVEPAASNERKRGSSFARAAAITVTFTLVSRIIGLVRESVIAAQYGQTFKTDAYQAAFTVPDLLMYLVAGGALASTFIPVFTNYLHKGDEKGASETFSTIATVIGVVALAFIALCEIFAPQFVILTNPGYNDDLQANWSHPAHLMAMMGDPLAHCGPRLVLATKLTRILLPAQLFFMLGSLMMGALNARRQFLIPTLGPIIYNLGIIFGAVFLKGMDIYGLTWGALVGAFIGNFVLQLFFVAKTPLKFTISFDIRHPGVIQVWRMMLPILLGVSLPNVDQMINKYYASELGEGAQSAIMYAVRVMLIPIGVFAQAMGIAILPTLSAHVSSGDKLELRRAIVKGLRTVLFLSIPASALMYILAEPIIAVLYQHGKYTYENTQYAAGPLRFYSIGIFAWSAQAILTRSFYAVQDSRTPVISGTIMTIIFIMLNSFVVNHTDWGISGLAAMTSVAATLHAIVMLVILNKRVGKIADVPLAVSALKTLASTVCVIIVCGPLGITLAPLMPLTGRALNALGQVFIVGTLGVISFCALAYLMNMSELNGVISRLAGVMKRRRANGDASRQQN